MVLPMDEHEAEGKIHSPRLLGKHSGLSVVRLQKTCLTLVELACRRIERALARTLDRIVKMRERIARIADDLERRQLDLLLIHRAYTPFSLKHRVAQTVPSFTQATPSIMCGAPRKSCFAGSCAHMNTE